MLARGVAQGMAIRPGMYRLQAVDTEDMRVFVTGKTLACGCALVCFDRAPKVWASRMLELVGGAQSPGRTAA